MDLAGGRSPATDCSRRVSGGKLPRIPLIDVTDAGPVALITAARERCERLLEAGRRCYGPAFITIGDPLSRRWLARSRNPYLDEIDSIAAALDRPGAYVLNLSYEWSCTSAIAADSEFGGSRLQRTVDWPLAGLGRNLIDGPTSRRPRDLLQRHLAGIRRGCQ